MRRALGNRLPALSHFYGIKPWEVDDLTYSEVRIFLDAIARHSKDGG